MAFFFLLLTPLPQYYICEIHPCFLQQEFLSFLCCKVFLCVNATIYLAVLLNFYCFFSVLTVMNTIVPFGDAYVLIFVDYMPSSKVAMLQGSCMFSFNGYCKTDVLHLDCFDSISCTQFTYISPAISHISFLETQQLQASQGLEHRPLHNQLIHQVAIENSSMEYFPLLISLQGRGKVGQSLPTPKAQEVRSGGQENCQ